MLLLNIKWWHFIILSFYLFSEHTSFFSLISKVVLIFFHGNLETNVVCPVLLVVARLWGKPRAIWLSLSYILHVLFSFFCCYGPSYESEIKSEWNWIVFATVAPIIIPVGNTRGGKVEKLSVATLKCRSTWWRISFALCHWVFCPQPWKKTSLKKPSLMYLFHLGVNTSPSAVQVHEKHRVVLLKLCNHQQQKHRGTFMLDVPGKTWKAHWKA